MDFVIYFTQLNKSVKLNSTIKFNYITYALPVLPRLISILITN